MISAIEWTWPFKARHTPLGLKIKAYTAVVVAKLRAVAPYALIELILPGGSVMALLLWLYRRHKKPPVFTTWDILALLEGGVAAPTPTWLVNVTKQKKIGPAVLCIQLVHVIRLRFAPFRSRADLGSTPI